MSHSAEIKTALTDLNALRAGVHELGAQWLEGVTTYKSYQTGLKCLHVIRLPGVGYEIGVTKSDDGSYSLNWDTYGEGQKLLAKFGEGCVKLVDAYSIHKTINMARSRGYMVRRQTLADGRTELQLTGMR